MVKVEKKAKNLANQKKCAKNAPKNIEKIQKKCAKMRPFGKCEKKCAKMNKKCEKKNNAKYIPPYSSPQHRVDLPLTTPSSLSGETNYGTQKWLNNVTVLERKF